MYSIGGYKTLRECSLGGHKHYYRAFLGMHKTLRERPLGGRNHANGVNTPTSFLDYGASSYLLALLLMAYNGVFPRGLLVACGHTIAL